MRLTPCAHCETSRLTLRTSSETHAIVPLCNNRAHMQQGRQIGMQDGAQGQTLQQK